jgi:hypothetical protein
VRWLIGLLLLVNLVLFLWGHWYRPADSRAVDAGDVEIGEIRLWSEVRPPDSQPANDEIERPANEGGGPARDRYPGEMPASERGEAVREGAAGAAVAQPAMSGETPDASGDRIPEPRQAPKVQVPQPEADEEVLVLRQNGATGPADEPRFGEPPVTRVCGEVRGFADEAAARAFLDELQAQGIEAGLHTEVTQEQTGYWVLLPAQPNLVLARQLRTELRDKGVEDLWLFTAGPMRNIISLGMFTGSVRANRRAEEIRALGFAAEVRPKMNSETIFVISYELRDGESASPTGVVGGRDDLESRPVACAPLP